MKEKRQAERARAAGRRYGQDHELERSMLKELENIRRSLGSSVTTEVASVVRELREEVAQIGRERERLRSAREMMQRTLMAGDVSYVGFGAPGREFDPRQPSLMRHAAAPFYPE
jgi:hypothetical protein